ncbi:peptidoglycan DD-metalloendopeptidase family protein [Coralloluteibacterium stylophorae]|uniref:Peptidoglycan DD-metalloendopeptidase family protein n=1 Tax=Coralloluteibacterium stylophorae TaxID=1776034 RepID=A0A8J7VV90_9GAMM|nr:peptidoglycan DD-metalloendopeptidase family protein [Coralloluteibacterium stylophorae]MBS7459003.1 peptidoglycan DD-metalloendopeptidase family protein [Coralloluteibacterium stylophorae]
MTSRILCAVMALLVLGACGRSVVVTRDTAPSRPAGRPAAPLPASGSYVVARGDTLYGIAFRHGLDYRELAARNGIAAPYTIYPGQRIRLDGAPQRAPVAAAPRPAAPLPAGTPDTTAARTPLPPLPSATPAATPAPAPVASAPKPAPEPPAQVDTRAGAWRWPADGQIVGRFVAGDPTRQGLDIAGDSGDPVRASAAGVVVYSGAGLVGYGELIIIKHSDEWLSAYGHNRKRLVDEGDSIAAGQQIAEMGRSGASRDMLHFEIRRNGKPTDPLPLLPKR